MAKKRKPLGPRRKRMERSARLASARATNWVANFSGKNIVRGYRKWFGVDSLCAVAELRALGVPISVEREKELRTTEAATVAARAARKSRREVQEPGSLDSDGTFAFIAGYTPAGFPYGVTWDEWRELSGPEDS